MRSIKLIEGGSSGPEHGACWMQAVSFYAGEKWSDHPKCVCPVIRRICIIINDGCTDDYRGEIVGPRLFDPIGTKVDFKTSKKRVLRLCEIAFADDEKHGIRSWTDIEIVAGAALSKLVGTRSFVQVLLNALDELMSIGDKRPVEKNCDDLAFDNLIKMGQE